MSKILFLDDSHERTRAFSNKVPHAETFETAEAIIERLQGCSAPVDMVFLDHDLGGEVYVDSRRPDTGMEVVRFIEKARPKICEVIVHTLNMPAGDEMMDRLKAAGYDARRIPFTILLRNLK